ncbi:fumarylacetoacetate hydrolase family protein [Halomonas sp. MCCC 1A11036]|uniref:Fumarylacetoacetate hydrolase family protein n=1 Tax=Billgrantia zhangzhouensis TaxID=2733481 RepID=A0ABS9AJQ1_9GAMM|nr:fumarylacetoacetate hydrolase family protein [Halomonas zhangzhouensis]MCE8021963.1 fumarylacetoacetate hydrolase family protein [Halomonas zhangzhouensis]
MKLFTYIKDSEERVGAVLREGEGIDISGRLGGDGNRAPMGMLELLRSLKGDFSPLRKILETATRADFLMRDVRIGAPVTRPGKIVGIGRNYASHAGEGGLSAQEEPRLFLKASSSVIGPGDRIPCPPKVRRLDWEVELGVVIGRTMRDVDREDALSHVAGYTIINDVSAREFQFDVEPPQTSFAKSMDGFSPMGPVMVTGDIIPDPGRVELRCWVNGRKMQDGCARDMIFPVPYLLSYISRFMTLEPGDVVATGTPSGVGCFRNPPVYLRCGDEIRMEIAEIGVLENSVGLRSS